MIAKYFYERYISTSYYCILIISIIFLLLYNCFGIISFLFDLNNENNSLISIIFILIGRFLLGLSYLKQIAKFYIDIYVPLNHKIQANAKYNSSIYCGYIFGLLINCIFYFKLNKSYLFSGCIIMGLSFAIILIILIIIFRKFEEPKLFNELNDKKKNKNNVINNRQSNNESKDDKIINFENINDSIENIDNNEENEEPLLSNLIKEQKKRKMKYYILILVIIVFVLFTNQYINENLLLLLPLLIYNENENEIKFNIIIYPIISSGIFLISFLLQKCYLRRTHFQKNKKIVLIILSIFMIVFSLSFLPLCFNINECLEFIKDKYIYIIPIAFFSMILLNELYRIVAVNFFIRLLPSEKIGNLEASYYINIISKIGRLIPSLIICLFLGLSDESISLNSYGFSISKTLIFGLQSLFLLINLIFFLCFFSCIKNRPINRILSF
jgi:hypothetical protein